MYVFHNSKITVTLRNVTTYNGGELFPLLYHALSRSQSIHFRYFDRYVIYCSSRVRFEYFNPSIDITGCIKDDPYPTATSHTSTCYQKMYVKLWRRKPIRLCMYNTIRVYNNICLWITRVTGKLQLNLWFVDLFYLLNFHRFANYVQQVHNIIFFIWNFSVISIYILW